VTEEDIVKADSGASSPMTVEAQRDGPRVIDTQEMQEMPLPEWDASVP